MHKWAKEILQCVKSKVESIGLENFEGQNLDDLKDWTEIAKNIACFDKDYRIVDAMEKSEDEDEIMEMIERYTEYPDRRYYDNYRYADGRFAPKGHGTRRGYSEPYYHQVPNDYHEWANMDVSERRRDLDRMQGRMYYTESTPTLTSHSESNYDRAKRHYTESKEMHKANTPADKEQKMKDLEGYFKELSEDIMGLINDMSPEEKTMTKAKISALATKI